MSRRLTPSRRASGRATLHDVARLAQVSVMTASRALRGEPTVDEVLAARVHQAAQKLEYAPDPAARALASQRSTHVAILVPSLTNALFVELLESAQGVLRSAGYESMIGVTHYDGDEEEQLVREHLRHRPAGMLLSGLEQSKNTRQIIATAATPCVHMMAPAAEPGVYSVGFSQFEAAAALTRHLLHSGRRRIAFAAAQLDGQTMQRLQGWKATLLQVRRHDARLEWLNPAPSSLGLGAQMFEQIIASKPKVDAIFFCNDDLAQGALSAATRLGVEVPSQVAIAGFNDLPQSAYMVPSLTTVRTPREEVGRQAARMLVQVIRKERPEATHVDLGFKLMIRQSA